MWFTFSEVIYVSKWTIYAITSILETLEVHPSEKNSVIIVVKLKVMRTKYLQYPVHL